MLQNRWQTGFIMGSLNCRMHWKAASTVLAGHGKPHCKSSRRSGKNEEYKHQLPLLGCCSQYIKERCPQYLHIAALVSQRHSSTKQQMLDDGSATPTLTFSQALPFSHE